MTENRVIENILDCILTEYAKGEILAENLDNTRKDYKQELHKIKDGYGLNKKNEKIILFGGYTIKRHINDKTTGIRLRDWEIITSKDEEAKLLSCVADYLVSTNDWTKQLCGYEVLKRITENVLKYYEDEFCEEIENCKNDFQQSGCFDYVES